MNALFHICAWITGLSIGWNTPPLYRRLKDKIRRRIALYILDDRIKSTIFLLEIYWTWEDVYISHNTGSEAQYKQWTNLFERHLYRVKKLKRKWERRSAHGHSNKTLGLNKIKLLQVLKNKLFVFYSK